MTPDQFPARVDEIANNTLYDPESIKSAIWQAIDEYAQMEPSEEVISAGEGELDYDGIGLEKAYRAMSAAQLKAVKEGAK